jgi:hypothetical protein
MEPKLGSIFFLVKTENQNQTRTDSLKMLGWRSEGSF